MTQGIDIQSQTDDQELAELRSLLESDPQTPRGSEANGLADPQSTDSSQDSRSVSPASAEIAARTPEALSLITQKRQILSDPRLKARARSQWRFLKAYARYGTVLKAAKHAGIHRRTHQEWLTVCPEYKEAFKLVEADHRDLLVDEVRRRAVEGVEVAVFGKDGSVKGHRTEYSDNLLMFLTKQKDPSFRDGNRAEITVKHSYDPEPFQKLIQSDQGRALLRQLSDAVENAIDVTPGSDGSAE